MKGDEINVVEFSGKAIPAVDVLVFYGLPCTGKSTVIEKMKNEGNYEIIRIDEVWSKVSRHPTYSISESERVFSMLLKRLRNALKKGQFIIIEGVFASTERVLLIKKQVKLFKRRALFILLEASDQVIESRLKDRKELAKNSISFEKYLWLKKRFESESLCDLRFRTDSLSEDDILISLESVILKGS